MRIWDLARAAKAEKVGFWAEIGGYFFIFRIGGGARIAYDPGGRLSWATELCLVSGGHFVTPRTARAEARPGKFVLQ